MKKIFTRTGDSARQGRAKTIVNLNHEKGAYYRIPEALGLLKTLCIYDRRLRGVGNLAGLDACGSTILSAPYDALESSQSTLEAGVTAVSEGLQEFAKTGRAGQDVPQGCRPHPAQVSRRTLRQRTTSNASCIATPPGKGAPSWMRPGDVIWARGRHLWWPVLRPQIAGGDGVQRGFSIFCPGIICSRCAAPCEGGLDAGREGRGAPAASGH